MQYLFNVRPMREFFPLQNITLLHITLLHITLLHITLLHIADDSGRLATCIIAYSTTLTTHTTLTTLLYQDVFLNVVSVVDVVIVVGRPPTEASPRSEERSHL